MKRIKSNSSICDPKVPIHRTCTAPKIAAACLLTTKAITRYGSLFQKFRNMILGIVEEDIALYKENYRQALITFGPMER